MTLREVASSGVKWSFASQGTRQGVQFLTTVILAHLLSPSDFGLMSMATVVIGFVTVFKDLGTSAAVIHQRNYSEALLSSLFWINVVFGLVAAVILFVLSPIAASFYSEPRVAPLLRLLSLTFIISGFSILHQAMLERDLAFNTLAKVEVSAVVLGSIVGIGAALLGGGVWSLVYQTLTIVTVQTIMLWATSEWSPKMTLYWGELKSVSNYSLNLTGSNIFNYFARNADYILIGRFLGAQQLGYYTLAYRLMLYPLQTIAHVTGRVTFPIYSKLQDDDKRFRNAYLRVVGSIALITFPMMLGLMAVREPFVLTFFGSQWAPVILLIMLLAPVGLIQSISTTVGAIYKAKGRTDWMLRWGIGAGIIVMIAFVVGLQWGIAGVAAAYAVVAIILSYPSLAIPFRLINLRVRKLVTVIWRSLLSGLVMFGMVGIIKAVLPADLPSPFALGILIPVGIAAYLWASWTLNRHQVRQMLDMVGVKI